MFIQRKQTIAIIYYVKGNVSRPKKESDDSSQTTIKTYQHKMGHFIPVPILPILNEEPKEDTVFDERVNPNEYEYFIALSPDIERSRINSSKGLAIFLIFDEINLYISGFAYVLVLFILNNIYDRNFLNLFDFFAELALFNSLFLLTLNIIYIVAIYTIKMREKRGEDFSTWEQGGIARNYHLGCENCLFEPNKDTTNNGSLTHNKQKRYSENSITINSNNTSKKNDTRNIILERELFAKYKIQLEIISLIEIKQHKKIYITKFSVSYIITDEKKYAILFYYDFIRKFFHRIISQYYIIIIGIFIIKYNEREECEQIFQYFLIIRILCKNIFDKSYEFIDLHSLITVKNTLLILTKENFNVNEFLNSSINDINKIHNNFLLSIIIDNIDENKKSEKFVRGEERRIFFLMGNNGGTAQNYHFGCENGLFEPNNVTTNTFKLARNEKIKNNNNIIIINKRKKGNKFLIRNINHLRNFIEIIKYIILLNIFNNIFVNNKICFIEKYSYNITQKIKCKGTKQIFSSDTDFFKSEYYPNEVHKNKYK